MAINDTPWCGQQDDKLYLQSGQFTSTVKTSEYVGAINSTPRGISYDGTNTPWNAASPPDKLFLQSGQFTSTIKTSEYVGGIDTDPTGISYDGTNTPWCGFTDLKLYLQSGQFTSTIKTSEYVGGIDTASSGISYDGTNTPWCGNTNNKLYLQSGQFTSTIKTSEYVGGIDTTPTGISYDGTNTPWIGRESNKLYLQSGQFTSTIKTSEYVGGIDTLPRGIETNDVNARLAAVVDITVTPSELILTSALPVPTLTGIDVNFAAPALALSISTDAVVLISDVIITPDELTLGLSQNGMATIAGENIFISLSPLALGVAIPGIPVISGDAILLLPGVSMILQETALSLHAPTINVTDDIRILVTNTRNFAISEYTNFAFNSMCRFNGRYLYARSDGIYEGGGDADNGQQIQASYKTGAMDTYTTEIQRLRDAYMTFRSNGDVQLFSVGDEVNARTYFITSSPGSTIYERRVKFGRGIKDRHFNFGISNINGSTLEIDSVKILTEPLRKRR
jgi:hypothetical protein